MSTTLIKPPAPSGVDDPPTFGDTLDDILPVIEVVPVYGPPVLLTVGPWLLFALVLAGPFAVLVTLVVLLAAAVALVGLIGGILAAPYLLVHRLREQRAGHAPMRVPAAKLLAGELR